jgi:hypothetical protein
MTAGVGGHQPRLWHRLVGDPQRGHHARRHRPGDQEHVGVARGRDDAPEALEVVERVGDRAQLVLAAVARPPASRRATRIAPASSSVISSQPAPAVTPVSSMSRLTVRRPSSARTRRFAH